MRGGPLKLGSSRRKKKITYFPMHIEESGKAQKGNENERMEGMTFTEGTGGGSAKEMEAVKAKAWESSDK